MPPSISNDLAGLRPAEYNPRQMSTRQRESLIKTYLDYGDLSGIVVNRRTGRLVGGHQRTDIFRKRHSKIVKKDYRDSTGTVAIGYAVVPTTGGGTIRIPYREVDWDQHKEMAGNVAANSGGGDWDDVKLGRVLEKLDQKRFAIERTGLDSLDVKKALRASESERKRRAHGAYGGNSQGENDEGKEPGFALVDSEALKAAAQHMCPSCGYAWDGSTKPSFGELHRLTPDNPARMLADQLGRQVRRRMDKTGESAMAAGQAVAAVRARRVQEGRVAGHFQPPPPSAGIVSDGKGRVRRMRPEPRR